MIKERTYREFRKMKRKYEHLLIGMSSNNEQICRDFETNTLFCNYKESHMWYLHPHNIHALHFHTYMTFDLLLLLIK